MPNTAQNISSVKDTKPARISFPYTENSHLAVAQDIRDCIIETMEKQNRTLFTILRATQNTNSLPEISQSIFESSRDYFNCSIEGSTKIFQILGRPGEKPSKEA